MRKIAGREVVYSTIMSDEVNKALADVMVARDKITNHIQNTGKSIGAVDCPVCFKGRVGFTQAKNGRIHAACSTPKCVKWAE